MDISKLNTEAYSIHHLSEADIMKIKKFHIANQKGKGLERYLKEMALLDEMEGNARTYLIKNEGTGEVAAYFTLKAGMITQQAFLTSFHTISGIELANFAVNDAYRETNDIVPQFGKYIFSQFIYPLVEDLSKYVGAAYLYIFALPENRLMEHYASMGFSRTEKKVEKYIHRHVKPLYDRGCIFMFQRIKTQKNNKEKSCH